MQREVLNWWKACDHKMLKRATHEHIENVVDVSVAVQRQVPISDKASHKKLKNQ